MACTFLPTTQKELQDLGWDYVDVIIVSGDAYVDHPSFGHAVIGRTLEKEGYRVAILPQPNWQDDLRDFKKLGVPRLFFGITAGCMDSMVNHYTAAKRLRSNDAYTAGGNAGFRPDYATIAYSTILKKLYPQTPVIIGGIEASMRRLAHYDYWSDTLKPSVLVESKADLLVYGMGEKVIKQIVQRISAGEKIQELTNIPQTAYLSAKNPCNSAEDILLSPYEDCLKSKKIQAKNFQLIEKESNKILSCRLIQKTGKDFVIINPPDSTFSTTDIDESFDLPYQRLPHPKYKKRGDIPAYEMIKFSVNIHRGCFGGCSFCTISAHQGKQIVSRSEESILNEIEQVKQLPGFKGYLSDLGGPSANMYGMQGRDPKLCEKCNRYSCMHPQLCKNLNSDHSRLIALYRKASQIAGIKKIFIGSGIRYDLFTSQNSGEQYFSEVVRNHVSGRLKVAPEHSSKPVLDIMRKPSFDQFVRIKKKFEDICAKENLKQQIIPYLISSHPGCTLKDMADLAVEMRKMNIRLEQVQDFTPTPMTLSTEMYYTEMNPETMQSLYVAKKSIQKKEQNELFFGYKKEYRQSIRNSLQRAGLERYVAKILH